MARILLIDDNKDLIHALRRILEFAGHTVYDAADGAAGMRIFRQERPELVFTDIFMPEQAGLETICMLKREFPTVKIVAMSGGGQNGMLNYLEMARKLGADLLLEKPFADEAILGILHMAGEELAGPSERVKDK